MKPMITDAPDAIRARFDRMRRDFGGTARALLAAHELAWRHGYDTAEPTCPAHDELAQHREGSVSHAQLRVRLSAELADERRLRVRWHAMRTWATGPSETEKADVTRAELAAAAQRRAVELRTEQLIAEQAAKAQAKARAQAEREVAGAQ